MNIIFQIFIDFKWKSICQYFIAFFIDPTVKRNFALHTLYSLSNNFFKYIL